MTIHRLARRIAAQASRRANRALVGTALSAARRYAVLDAYVARRNEGIVTAGQYLIAITGDAEFSAKYDSPFGKAIKKAYIAIHGEDPAQIRLTTENRRIHRAIGYRIDEPALQIALANYPRTAALIGA